MGILPQRAANVPETCDVCGQKTLLYHVHYAQVAQRTKGMGLKLVKFHMITHIMDDILQFGVPLEYDTSSNESMHKPSKKASKMTQRAAETFNFQVANCLVEFQLLDLTMVEIETGCKQTASWKS